MNKVIIFMLGVATGSVGTYFAVRKVIETKTDEEIESVVTTFKKRFEELENKQNSKNKEHKSNVNDAADALAASFKNLKESVEKLGYSNGVDLSEDESQQVEDTVAIREENDIPPYIIDEEHYGATGLDEETLILYADNILADEEDNEITDPETMIGNTLDYFDDEDDRMIVRNESKGIEYTVLRSERLYSDILEEKVEEDN